MGNKNHKWFIMRNAFTIQEVVMHINGGKHVSSTNQ